MTAASAAVTATLRNEGSEPVWLLTWGTPLEPQPGNIALVKAGADCVPCRAAAGHRVTPSIDDYVYLPAGTERQTSVDLSVACALSAGDVSVSLDFVVRDVIVGAEFSDRAPNEWQATQLTTNEVQLHLESCASTDAMDEPLSPLGNAAALSVRHSAADVLSPAGPKSPNIKGGTGRQKDMVIKAHQWAYQAIAQSVNLLSNPDSGTAMVSPANLYPPQYTTWFGQYTVTRYNTVVANFKALLTYLQTTTITYSIGDPKSGCGTNWIARTNWDPNENPYICPCDSFFGSGISALYVDDRYRALTLVHEFCHAILDMDSEWQTSWFSRILAQVSPDTAVKNEDSYALFADDIATYTDNGNGVFTKRVILHDKSNLTPALASISTGTALMVYAGTGHEPGTLFQRSYTSTGAFGLTRTLSDPRGQTFTTSTAPAVTATSTGFVLAYVDATRNSPTAGQLVLITSSANATNPTPSTWSEPARIGNGITTAMGVAITKTPDGSLVVNYASASALNTIVGTPTTSGSYNWGTPQTLPKVTQVNSAPSFAWVENVLYCFYLGQYEVVSYTDTLTPTNPNSWSTPGIVPTIGGSIAGVSAATVSANGGSVMLVDGRGSQGDGTLRYVTYGHGTAAPGGWSADSIRQPDNVSDTAPAVASVGTGLLQVFVAGGSIYYCTATLTV